MIVPVDLSTETVERIDRLARKFPLPPSRTEFAEFLIDTALHEIEARAAAIRRNNAEHANQEQRNMTTN